MKISPLLEQAIKIAQKKLPDVLAIYLFGSVGTAHENAESDIDLAILPTTKLAAVPRYKLAQEIAVAIKKDVDLIDLLQASTVLRFQIISTGTRIFCSNKTVCDQFEMVTYSMYLRFNEERRGILEDVKRRGRIYNG